MRMFKRSNDRDRRSTNHGLTGSMSQSKSKGYG